MKRVFSTIFAISCFMLVSFVASSNNGEASNNKETKTTQIKWLSFDDAVRQSQSQPKKIFIDLYTDWCTWCLKMEKATFEHPDIIEYINENFYPVKLDAETRKNILFQNNKYIYRPDAGERGVHELAIFLTRGRLNYPSVVFLDESLKNPQPVSGFQNPVQMDKLLKFFGEDYYKNLDWGIFEQIYESPLEQRMNPISESNNFDIAPISKEETIIATPVANTKQNIEAKQQNAKTVTPVSEKTPVAPKPTTVDEKATKSAEKEIEKTVPSAKKEHTKSKNARRKSKNRKSKK